MKDILSILIEATKSIPKEYIQLPLAGQEDPIYRERVYCYELYHHIRILWPPQTRYSLSGEVDKSGHSLIRGNNLDNTKPDILVHIPGEMTHNELVMEVKPINAKKTGIKKDLKLLTAYRINAKYKRAILLVYGGSDAEFNIFKKNIKTIIKQNRDESINLKLIEIWYHRTFNEEAAIIEWCELIET